MCVTTFRNRSGRQVCFPPHNGWHGDDQITDLQPTMASEPVSVSLICYLKQLGQQVHLM